MIKLNLQSINQNDEGNISLKGHTLTGGKGENGLC